MWGAGRPRGAESPPPFASGLNCVFPIKQDSVPLETSQRRKSSSFLVAISPSHILLEMAFLFALT